MTTIMFITITFSTLQRGAEFARPENDEITIAGKCRPWKWRTSNWFATTSLWRTFRMKLQTLHCDWLNSFDWNASS